MSDLSDYGPARLPDGEPLSGTRVTLEPILDERRFDQLFEAFAATDQEATFRYLGYGPFESRVAFRTFAKRTYLSPDLFFYALLPHAPGAATSVQGDRACGVMALMRADAANGVIEVGHICLAPTLQRTVAPSEAIFLLMQLAFDGLGYRRFEWKCDAGNARSRRAAERYGFTFEGIFRQHMVVKGLNRDTAWFSILDHEWPRIRTGFEAWLDEGNFEVDGRQKATLGAMRDQAIAV